ncbi:hypothetical protein [Corynebacterium caspium]|uniref:hypothetical protein n=1 Tax=Corynebacterium caspium TaxID=234828 RepID=UPI00037D10CD|nr:hypothetical protein [Corynebacterium caspium]WKD58654.1 hypothetical protein CCASP_01140 [Corynebacterium caspium DSM 44850]
MTSPIGQGITALILTVIFVGIAFLPFDGALIAGLSLALCSITWVWWGFSLAATPEHLRTG